MSLYNEIRPSDITKVQGEYQWVLDRLLEPKSNHAILFFGPSGCGKGTLARICAKAVGAEDYDTDEINFSTNGTVDMVRQIETDLQHAWGIKVYILDEFSRASGEAQRALKKVLEDIPENVYFFICASETAKIIPDIMTRCARVQVSPLNEDQMLSILEEGCVHLGFSPKPSLLVKITEAAAGSARTALNILEDLSKAPIEKYNDIIAGYSANAEDATAFELAKALFSGANWKDIAPILTSLKEQKAEGESVRRTLLGYVAAMCIKQPQHYKAVMLLSNNVYDSGLNGVIGMVGAIYSGGV